MHMGGKVGQAIFQEIIPHQRLEISLCDEGSGGNVLLNHFQKKRRPN